MARKSPSITSLPRSPEEDRRARMIKYSVTMIIRMVCIGLCLVVQGWWLLVVAAGAVFLPYVAVILANAVDARFATVERPDTTPRMITSAAPSPDGSEESPSP